MRLYILAFARVINLPRTLCNHALGTEHTIGHRCAAGAAVMTVGVVIAKTAELVHFPGAGFILDIIGYAVHGVGTTPYIEYLLHREGR